MIQTKDLFLLVNSLIAAERNIFSRSVDLKKGKKFLFLYETMSTSKTWEDARVQFEKKYSKSEYETSRKYLYKVIMKTLRAFEESKAAEPLLYNKIIEIKILFNKGLYDQCFKELTSTKEQAEKYEKHFILAELGVLEIEYLNALDFPQISEIDLLTKQESIEENLYKELFINKHQSLYQILQLRFITNGSPKKAEEVANLNDLLIEEFRIRSNKNYTLFNSDKAHLRFQYIYFRMSGDRNGALKICYELEELFKQGVLTGRIDNLSYLFLLDDILYTLRSLKQHNEMLYFLEKLKELKTDGELLTTYRDFFYFTHECSIFIDGAQLTGSDMVKEHYNALITKQNFLPENYNFLLHFQFAVILFVAGDYKKSLKIISKIQDPKNNQPNKKSYYLSKMLSVMIHILMEDFDFLHYEIRSIERKLAKEKNRYKLWDLIIRLIKDLLGSGNQKALLKEALTKIKELEMDEFESQFLIYLPIKQWLEKMINL